MEHDREKEPSTEIYYHVKPRKFLLLSIFTLGLYEIYWHYRCWKFIKLRDQSKIWPPARAVFCPLWYYAPLSDIGKRAQSPLLKSRVSRVVLARCDAAGTRLAALRRRAALDHAIERGPGAQPPGRDEAPARAGKRRPGVLDPRRPGKPFQVRARAHRPTAGLSRIGVEAVGRGPAASQGRRRRVMPAGQAPYIACRSAPKGSSTTPGSLSMIMVARLSRSKRGQFGMPSWFGLPLRAKAAKAPLMASARA